MTFEVDLDGRTHTVSVERAGPGRFRVVIDDAAHVVDAVRTGEHGLSLILDDEAAISRHVQVAPGGSGDELLVSLGGRTAVVTVNGRRSRRAGAEGAASTHGPQSIVAPMPGRIVRVLVAPGDEVAARQPVIVVEAMKMENELRATRAGRVKEVTVKAGASVEAGRILALLE
jgi:biotin carboxyl carrier protein